MQVGVIFFAVKFVYVAENFIFGHIAPAKK